MVIKAPMSGLYIALCIALVLQSHKQSVSSVWFISGGSGVTWGIGSLGALIADHFKFPLRSVGIIHSFRAQNFKSMLGGWKYAVSKS